MTENSAVSCIYCYYSQHKPRSPQLRTTSVHCCPLARSLLPASRSRVLDPKPCTTAVSDSSKTFRFCSRGDGDAARLASDGDRALTHLDDTSMTRGTCPQATSHSLCGGGVPSSHPRPLGLGFAVFFLFFPVLLLIWRVRVINYLEATEGTLMSVRTYLRSRASRFHRSPL